MDKGKKPIEENEDLAPFLGYDLSLALPSMPISTHKLPLSSERSGSGAEEQVISSDEMVSLDGELHLNFMTMNGGHSNFKTTTVGETSNVATPEVVVLPQDEALSTTVKRNPPSKALNPEELVALAREDPKHARRILTNRLSAMRAKERKRLYTSTLEHKRRALQSQSRVLSAKLSFLQAETRALRAENAKLKERMNTILPQLELQASLNEQIRTEIQHLKTMKAKFVQNAWTIIDIRAVSANNFQAGATPLFPLLPAQIPNLQGQFWRYPHQGQYELGQNTQHPLLQQHFPQQPRIELPDSQSSDPLSSEDDSRTESVSSK